MADIASSDGHVTVRLHTAWSSVLLWHDLTGPVTVTRNGVVVATIPDLQGYWYDHFPALGVPSAYVVSNGTTTSTAATITVPALTSRKTWVKSAADPNLSRAASNGPKLLDVTYPDSRGVFDIDGSSVPYIVYDTPKARRREASWTVLSAAERDALVAVLRSGTVFVQFDPSAGEADMWASPSEVRVTRPGFTPRFVVSTALTEVATPTPPSAVTIPGWGWSDVQALYASWTAETAANASWLALIQRGVS